MIELQETATVDGTKAVVTGLRTATCRIDPTPDNIVAQYRVKTSRKSNGSIRYHGFATYTEAAEYALQYATRIAAQKIEKQS